MPRNLGTYVNDYDVPRKKDVDGAAETAETAANAYTDGEIADVQSQIDALVSKSDVVDVVGTYVDLQNYDTTTLLNNDVVKVLSDSTHTDSRSYYRWVVATGGGVWSYIGSESVGYTRSETDTLLDAKQNTVSDLATIRSGAALGATAVQPISGKGLSTNDYTTTEKTKLEGIATGATAVSESTVAGWGFTKNDGTYSKPTGGIPKSDLSADVQAKLDSAELPETTAMLKGNGSGGAVAATAGTDYIAPENGKGLSTNDYTTAEKNKLAGVEAGANKTVLTTAQLAALNSNITSSKTASYDQHIVNENIHVTSTEKSKWNSPQIVTNDETITSNTRIKINTAGTAYRMPKFLTGTAISGTAQGITTQIVGSQVGDLYINEQTNNVYMARLSGTDLVWDYKYNMLGAVPYNINLLDNADWYAYIVNQRGVSDTTLSDAYGVDRWRTTGRITVHNAESTAGYITMVSGCAMKQRIEILPAALSGKTITAAVDIGGTVHSDTVTFPSSGETTVFTAGGVTVTVGIDSGTYNLCNVSAAGVPYIRITASSAVNVRRVWLELGSVCHMETTLPKSYADNLAVCKRYFNRVYSNGNFSGFVKGTTTNVQFYIPMSTSMRNAAISVSTPSKITVFTARDSAPFIVETTNLSIVDVYNLIDGILLIINTHATVNTAFTVVGVQLESVDVSAEL